jgi:hypothetical protein
MHPPQPIIPDRAEFVDVLSLMRRGHLLVQNGDTDSCCLLSGAPIYHSMPTLRAYGLIDPVTVPDQRPRTKCWRLSPRGRDFADRATREWRRKPLLQRVAVRLLG